MVLGPNGLCVPPQQCPCRYGDSWENAGSVKRIGCKELKCRNATWIDTDVGDCPATCFVSGDPHYQTFDGKFYSFQGDCAYVLAQSSEDNTFSVVTRNVKCGLTGVTCTKEITVTLKGNVISLFKDKPTTLNEVEIPEEGYISSNIMIKRSGIFLSILTKFGLTVQWDLGTRIYVFLKNTWKRKVEGLCGNFDGIMNNDFLSKQKSLEQKPSSFAHSWRVYECPVSDKLDSENYEPCEKNSYRKPWATDICSIIKHGAVFAKCRASLPNIVIETYYQDCLFDACGCDLGGDCECVCTAISNFHTKCAIYGFPVRWRKQDLCPIQCENKMVYLECGPANPPTCYDDKSAKIFANSPSYCVEGCFCPPGLLLDGGKCVTRDECPCHIDGKFFSPGSVILKKNCMNCTCTKGDLLCVNTTCKKCNMDEFECAPGTCIMKNRVCDGYIDCEEGTDEEDCPSTVAPYTTFMTTVNFVNTRQKYTKFIAVLIVNSYFMNDILVYDLDTYPKLLSA
ncbi:SCO-spondin [Octopus bimaculoides]|uniref:SCO-spondin n=1 Tax=Octopus bimaculoides TaxID=37653 RepID=UPI0022DF6328|nr:SCO-spondin [Octopus bimaculoides]